MIQDSKESVTLTRGQIYLTRASGEGTHSFRVCESEAELLAFYEEMFGKDEDGTLDLTIKHFHNHDNWSNDGTAYECALYCAKWEVWKVDRNDLRSAAPVAGGEEYARLRGLIEQRISGMAMPADPGPMQECAKCAHSELSDLLAAFDSGETPAAPLPTPAASDAGPQVGSPSRCAQHGGYGFVSDCEACQMIGQANPPAAPSPVSEVEAVKSIDNKRTVYQMSSGLFVVALELYGEMADKALDLARRLEEAEGRVDNAWKRGAEEIAERNRRIEAAEAALREADRLLRRAMRLIGSDTDLGQHIRRHLDSRTGKEHG